MKTSKTISVGKFLFSKHTTQQQQAHTKNSQIFPLKSLYRYFVKELKKLEENHFKRKTNRMNKNNFFNNRKNHVFGSLCCLFAQNFGRYWPLE